MIDEAIVAACGALIVGDGAAPWSAWEADESLRDIELLGEAGDCCYDRPSIGVAYALWHHGARTQDALRMLLPMIERNGTQELNVVDLGCGTGATACAALLAVDAMRRIRRPAPESVLVLGVDQSTFMVDVARDIVAVLSARLDLPKVRTEFLVSRWEDVKPADSRTVITAGYLLDHSDREHADEIADRLESLAERTGAEEVVLSTTAGKEPLLDRLTTRLDKHGWRDAGSPLADPIRGDGMAQCRDLRSRWYRGLGVTRDREGYLDAVPTWRGPAPAARALSGATGRVGATLFDSSEHLLEFDDQQREAATPADGPTVITGPAGSGKTLVLAERVALTVVSAKAEANLRILVTAFNKEVVALLEQYVTDALHRHSAHVDAREQRWENDKGNVKLSVRVQGRRATIQFLNRDKLPTQVFRVRSQDFEDWWTTIKRRRQGLPPDDRRRLDELSDAFLESEFERFIVGKGRLDKENYVKADRPGSGRRLGEHQKELIWDLTMEPRIASHGMQRLLAIERGAPSATLSRLGHVFIDECQDFGEAEIRLLAACAPGSQRLCMAGDPSQSIHLGRSYRHPVFDGRRWRSHRLEGSYRLPIRVCEALQPLARALIERGVPGVEGEIDAVLLGPRKRSVLGIRPVVVRAEDLRGQLPAVLGTYGRTLNDRRLFVADSCEWIRGVVKGAALEWEVTCGSMLEFKGCEWSAVIATDAWAWSKRKDVNDPDYVSALQQQALTALTRSKALLVIVLAEPSRRFEPVTRFLGLADPARLLFWTEEAKHRFVG